MDRVAAWPEEDQDKLIRFVGEIEAGRQIEHELNEEDYAAIERSIADADAGRFAPDGAVEALFNRYFK
ncbi:hypothetical protein [Rhodopseudomonas sp. P2A-2r]|uniref:hypothetical protein n=1 Tax=unclassified Rhodopseudomonas TaxID=2638247 RepID=UPI002234B249|nr:hypothetical protein [Rhodopseudomonas sp. P2A-2r]UZE49137.1 hypothetical protein ONR75_31315 [Rhodopseudomonas sp. P2A-2r]